MKMIKFALLGTAAIAAVSVSARADSLSDLKAQIEALNARVATIETAPAVPAGFSLMTVGTAPAIVIPGEVNDRRANEDYAATATQIGIMPTADAPASTVIQWSGFVRAALVYDYVQVPGGNQDNINVKARGQIKVTGKTDTAVGEVGAAMTLRASWESNDLNRGSVAVTSPGAWGYWKMTPELTLGGGMDGSLAGNGYGYDGACNCYYTDNANAGYGHDGDPAQMRLSYASGPLSAAIALEDEHNTVANNAGALGVAGEIKFSGDTISGELSGGYWGTDGAVARPEAAYVVDAGMKFALGDMANISMSGGVGSGHAKNDDFWKANILGSVNLSSAAHAEIGFNHVTNEGANNDQNSVLAGVYYDPVSQLTIGLEGEYIMNEGANNDTMSADLVTVFRF